MSQSGGRAFTVLPALSSWLGKILRRSIGGIPEQWFNRAGLEPTKETLQEPYRNSVWVMRAIKKVAGPIAAVPVEVYRAGALDEMRATMLKRGWRGADKLSRAGATRQLKRTHKLLKLVQAAGLDADEASVDNPALNEWLAEPAPRLSWADFVEASTGWIKLAGETFWLREKVTLPFPDQAGGLQQVYVARPDRMREQIGAGKITGWQYVGANGVVTALTPEQVTQVKCWNPYSDVRGLAEFESAAVSANSDWLAGKFNSNLMANNGDQGVLIVADKDTRLTSEQQAQIVSTLREKRALQQAGVFRPAFLPAGLKVEDPKVLAPDANFISSRLNNRHEIALAFGVPPSMFDVKAAYSIGSASDYYQLIVDTCMPTAEKIGGGLERLLSDMLGFPVEVVFDWDEHPVMQFVRRERIASVDTFWSKGVPMDVIGEYLDLDLPEYEGSDKGYLPFSVTPAADVGMEAFTADDYSEEPDKPVKPTNGDKDLPEVLAMKMALATKASGNARLWASHMKQRQKAAKQIQGKVGKLLNEYRAKALAALAHHWALGKSAGQIAQRSDLLNIIFDGSVFGKDLASLLHPTLQGICKVAASELLAEVGYRDPWELPPSDLLGFLSTRDIPIKTVGSTVQDQVRTVVEEGLEKGWTLNDITDAIKAKFNDLQRYEAKRIALTESNAAYGFSRQKTMEGVGIEWKAWLTSHGPNVRDAHAEAETRYTRSEPIPVDEPFIVGGEELMYPGDANGSPENVINCFLPGSTVSGRFIGGLKAGYSGEAWTIKTRKGHRLSVTPNHPILTQRGWIKANSIRKGDSLLCAGRKVKPCSLRAINHQDVESRVEDVFKALLRNGTAHVSTCSDSDLYGDAVCVKDGNVNIVAANRELVFSHEASSAQAGANLPFVFSNTKLAEVERLCSGNLRSGQIVRTAPSFPSRTQEPIGFFNIAPNTNPSSPLCIGTIADWDSVKFQGTKERGSAGVDFAGALLKAHAGLIEFDEVVNAERFQFSGLIYDFHTDTGYIMSGGIVNSNCQCVTLAIMEPGR